MHLFAWPYNLESSNLTSKLRSQGI